MSLDSGILEEFSLEALELLDDAEDSLLKLKGEENYKEIYNSVFRAFHSLKGSSGMVGFDVLQSHLHLLEDFLQKSKGDLGHFTRSVDYYLSGIDAARKILNGEKVAFKYEVFSDNSKKEIIIHTTGVLLCVLWQESDDLVKHLDQFGRELGYQVKVISFEKADKLFFTNENYSMLISDFPLSNFVDRVSSKKLIKPFLYLSENYDDCQNLDHMYFYVRSEGMLRLKSLLTLLYKEEKYLDLYDKARGLMMYMFSDMEEYLLKNNKHEIHKSITTEIRDFVKKFGK